jgi:hypothetical protein
MSQQPPEGAYAQPQDPWEGGYEPGLASVPTDPIPEQRFDGYPPADLWSQQTVAQGGYVAQPPARNRTGMIVLIVLIVLILGGGGGYAAYYVTSKRNPTADPTADPTPSGQPTTTATATQFDPYAVQPDNCLRNNNGDVPDPNTVDPHPQIEIVPCTTEGSYRVIKIVKGEELLENPDGKLDQNTTAPAACKDTGYKFWYAYDATDNTQDLFFCLVSANGTS